MGKRRLSRQIALQALYQIEMNATDIDYILEYEWMEEHKVTPDILEYSTELVLGIKNKKEELNEQIEDIKTKMKIYRLNKIDEIILLIACYEILTNKETSYIIYINEAIELAKKYSEENSYKLLNIILEKYAVMYTDSLNNKSN